MSGARIDERHGNAILVTVRFGFVSRTFFDQGADGCNHLAAHTRSHQRERLFQPRRSCLLVVGEAAQIQGRSSQAEGDEPVLDLVRLQRNC
jgi:hypothetical protein